eukprot:c12315_g1_i3.p1 GENE.c12315_g1_i3~~c12315_g1_i3.p1  ORF type:complete len:335 (+),score=89.38 c12315_g1_i3:71-1075(+)
MSLSVRGTKGGTASKYMVSIDKYMYLSNLVSYLNRDWAALPPWEQNFISDIKESVQYRIKDHFDATAATRQKFASMPPATWKEQDTGLFRLNETPRPVLGYLPAKELQVLDELCHTPIVGEIEDARATLTHLFEAMRACDKDTNEVKELLRRDSFFIQDVEEHRKAVEHWTDVSAKKLPIIKELEARERFLDEVEEFEKRTSGDKTRYYARNSLKLAEESKFRASAAKKLVQMDQRAVELCEQFKQQTGRDFEVDGIKYLDMISEQRVGRSSLLFLSLAKLRPEAMPASTLPKRDSNKEMALERRKSLHAQGANANGLIRNGRDSLNPPLTART